MKRDVGIRALLIIAGIILAFVLFSAGSFLERREFTVGASSR